MKLRLIRNTLLAGIVLFMTACGNEVKKTYHENGKLSAVMPYKDGMLHGLCVWYYANGNPMLQAEYSNNKVNGRQERFYENGVLQSVAWYKNNQLDSVMLHYNLNGRLVLEEYYVDDTLHGPYRRYYDDGSLFIDGAYHKGLMHSSWIFYSADGQVAAKGEFAMGNGTQKAWYPNGNTQRIIHYRNNQKHGIEEHYQPDGRLTMRRVFENGVMVAEEILD